MGALGVLALERGGRRIVGAAGYETHSRGPVERVAGSGSMKVA